VVSDLHAGCRLGLCPSRIPLDDGGTYESSPFQKKTKALWDEFHNKFVPSITQGEPHALVVNGDALEGVHHGSVTQVSHNIEDQLRIAETLLAPVVKKAAAYHHVRGTEAHVGPSGQYEERLARTLGAAPNEQGQFAGWELWAKLGANPIHFAHHVGTTGSSAYESTAVHKETVESFVEAGRWGDEPPAVIVRSHRHRYIEVRIGSSRGYTISVVTPGFQGKTPFAHKIPGARVSQPQFGGIVIRLSRDGSVYVAAKVWRIERPKEVFI
jgi:hypothetical protein